MADNNTIGGQHYEMMRRCYNPKSVSYKDYGAKGIKVCPEWHDREVFKKWCLDNGYKKGLRINRKDSSLDYTPDNCFLGVVNKAKHGKNEAIRKSIKDNKVKKSKIGLKRLIDSPLYETYTSMHTRCENPKHKHFKSYGGRGIAVCKEWSGKEGIYNFIEWMQKQGWHPGLTIDRIDNNKGYSPDNCRLATMQQQLRNRRYIKFYEYKGIKLTITEIAQLEKIPRNRLSYRLNKKKMSLDEAIAECRKGK